MTTKELYDQYKVISNLQDHLYRVAGVGWLLADAYADQVDKDQIVKACLLHDIANIIKFDLMRHPETLEPQGFDYWNQVRNEMIAKYGDDENQAHYAVAREIGMPEKVIELMQSVGFPKSCDVINSGDLAAVITAYADRRVDFNGVTSAAERDEKGRQRYGYEVTDFSRQMNECCLDMEERIFAGIDLSPEDINNDTVNSLRPSLEQYLIA